MNKDIREELEKVMARAYLEDRVEGDCTTLACVDETANAEAEIVAKDPLTVAGINFLETCFFPCEVEIFVKDGDFCPAQTILAKIKGPARNILSKERIALNLLQHLSGIATLTSQYVKAVEGFSCEILDTRKTLPGMRLLQKYAVKVGGGVNHRMNLSDQVLIKDNHLAFLKGKVQNPIRIAIEEARRLYPSHIIEVEVENLEDLDEALSAKADRIMLDNMSVEMVKKAVLQAGGKAYLEASGGINLSSVRDYASTGVNGVSIGAFTHSVRAIDISLSLNTIYDK